MSFEPRIIAFLCNWCSYGAADMAGTSRVQYPSNVRIIRFMCSGRIDPNFVVEAFLRGADGVMMTGCHIGDCHYIDGNYKTVHRYEFLSHYLDVLGIGSERLKLAWCSAAEGNKFASEVKEFTDLIRGLGPSPMRGDDDE
ncbi:hydrogenase iron-sulfur subunit [archaeon]|nr:MAG: hydrogenase iron-sulfur subunit [archaeon]